MFEKYPPVRDISYVQLGRALADIESHMPANHIYKHSDKITWGHETTHGINAKARNEFSYKLKKNINAFYVLDDQVAIIEEPNTTLKAVAAKVPKSLRGDVYELYLIKQQKYWNEQPLYILDEWTSYTNGAAVRLNLDIIEREETVLYMLEFNVYSLCVGYFTNDQDLKNYIRWGLSRAMRLYRYSKVALGGAEKHDEYLETIRTADDAKGFREFVRNYLNFEWTESILGF